MYAGCCALGPGITPAWEVSHPYNLAIHLSIERKGQVHWKGETSTGELKRRFDELVDYLFLENDFPDGVFLCTGTALVPESPFTLEPGDIISTGTPAGVGFARKPPRWLVTGDVVTVTVEGVGTLVNPVVREQ